MLYEVITVGFHQHQGFVTEVVDAQGVAYVERGMGPGGLGQVLDGGAEAAGTFHQQYVALAQGGGQHLGLDVGYRRGSGSRVGLGRITSYNVCYTKLLRFVVHDQYLGARGRTPGPRFA